MISPQFALNEWHMLHDIQIQTNNTYAKRDLIAANAVNSLVKTNEVRKKTMLKHKLL